MMYAGLMSLVEKINDYPVLALWRSTWLMATTDAPCTDLASMWLHWTAEQRRLWRKGHTYRGMFL